MSFLLFAVAGALVIGAVLIAVITLPHRAGTYRRTHAAGRPLYDRTEALL